jgi:hypothetical protein
VETVFGYGSTQGLKIKPWSLTRHRHSVKQYPPVVDRGCYKLQGPMQQTDTKKIKQNGTIMALLCEFVHWNVDVPSESIKILKTSGGC